jgi:two-component system, NarL family, nitrate/nitrite response regulator NarL
MRCVRVLIADRDPLVLQGLINLIKTDRHFEVIAGCRNSKQCIRVIRNESPDIALIDILMPGIFELELFTADTAARPLTRVIFLTASAELRRLATPSSKTFRKQPVLMHCLRQLATDKRSASPAPTDEAARPNQQIFTRNGASIQSLALLTEREREITYLVSEGFSNKGVGQRLNISEGTIKFHLHHIYQKLSIANRASLAALVAAHLGQNRLAAR